VVSAASSLAACDEVVGAAHPTVERAAPRAQATPAVPTPPSPAAPLPPAADPAPPTPPVASVPTPTARVVDDAELKAAELISGAREALGLGELDRALKLARLATLRAPNRAQAWNTLGRVQLRRGEKPAAVTAFERAVELNPSSSYAQNNLGLALIYQGRYEDAVDALEEATALEPVEGYMWNNLGMALEHLDRLEEARVAYRQAEELKGERAPTNLARLKGVRSVLRTARAEPPPVPSAPSDQVATDPPLRDGGAE
jgi:Flp pilus assembly protein TadD